MVTINIFDRNFIPYDDCSTHGKSPLNIRYVKNQRNFDGVTIFTDHCFDQVKGANSKFNIAWQVESPIHSNRHFYPMVKQYGKMFDQIWTYDEELVQSDSSIFKRVNFGGTTVNNISVDGKHNKKFCIIHSGKRDTPNHLLRQRVIDELSHKYNIDVFGRVTGNPFENIEDIYHNYMFPIVIENINHTNYFSEKLTDALACGCIPLYNGSTNSAETLFNKDGVICWDSFNKLEEILKSNLNEESFNILHDVRLQNSKTVSKYYYTNEDWLFEKYLKNINIKT